MCGRFAVAQTRFERIEQILATEFPERTPRYNIAPTQTIAAIRQSQDGAYVMEDCRWGLVPFWAKESKLPYSTFNARIETVETKPVFRAPFKTRRCLIPASGWYEWETKAGKKLPHYFTSAGDEGLALGGLWDTWHGPDGFTLRSCTILVGPANELVSTVHDRMPLILPDSAYRTWLDPNQPLDVIRSLLQPFDADQLRGWAVTPAVNQARNDYPELLTPLT